MNIATFEVSKKNSRITKNTPIILHFHTGHPNYNFGGATIIYNRSTKLTEIYLRVCFLLHRDNLLDFLRNQVAVILSTGFKSRRTYGTIYINTKFYARFL